MTLDRATVDALLPCFLCGDLPDEVHAAIESALAEDADLRGRLETLEGGRDACLEALSSLSGAVPDLDHELDLSGLLTAAGGPAASDTEEAALEDFEEAPTTVMSAIDIPARATQLSAANDAPAATTPYGVEVPKAESFTPPPPSRPLGPAAASVNPGGLALGLAAAVALLAVLAGGPPQQPAEVQLLDTHQQVVQEPAGFIATTDGGALMDALRAAGADPRLAMAPDLTDWGYTLVGGSVSGRGVVLVYERDGRRYTCQIYSARVTSSRPDVVQDASGVVVRGFQEGELGVVSWTAGGRTCLFSGPAPVAELMAFVTERIERSRGAREG